MPTNARVKKVTPASKPAGTPAGKAAGTPASCISKARYMRLFVKETFVTTLNVVTTIWLGMVLSYAQGPVSTWTLAKFKFGISKRFFELGNTMLVTSAFGWLSNGAAYNPASAFALFGLRNMHKNELAVMCLGDVVGAVFGALILGATDKMGIAPLARSFLSPPEARLGVIDSLVAEAAMTYILWMFIACLPNPHKTTVYEAVACGVFVAIICAWENDRTTGGYMNPTFVFAKYVYTYGFWPVCFDKTHWRSMLPYILGASVGGYAAGVTNKCIMLESERKANASRELEKGSGKKDQ